MKLIYCSRCLKFSNAVHHPTSAFCNVCEERTNWERAVCRHCGSQLMKNIQTEKVVCPFCQ